MVLLYICSCARSNLKKVSLELGGKSPLIIFSDCDNRTMILLYIYNHGFIVYLLPWFYCIFVAVLGVT